MKKLITRIAKLIDGPTYCEGEWPSLTILFFVLFLGFVAFVAYQFTTTDSAADKAATAINKIEEKITDPTGAKKTREKMLVELNTKDIHRAAVMDEMFEEIIYTEVNGALMRLAIRSQPWYKLVLQVAKAGAHLYAEQHPAL